MWFRLKQSLDFEENSWTIDACRGDRMRPDHHKMQELWQTGWSSFGIWILKTNNFPLFPFQYDVSKSFFLKTMRCYCTFEGCKILVGLKITPVVLMPWICSYFLQFYFLLFWPRQRFSYFFDLGKWRSEKSRGWNRCARAFHCLESWYILKMVSL